MASQREGSIYLDHMASTPLDPRVAAAMRPWLDPGAAGNPHSQHGRGWHAAEAVQAAAGAVAALIGARPGEIVFTSGATEANNLALFGASRRGCAVFASAIEHPSVMACLPELERRVRQTRVVPVDHDGTLRLDQLERSLSELQPGGAVVSVMAASHEVGTLQPLAEVAALVRPRGALLHTDATQLLGTDALDVEAQGIDLLSFSAHKLYGPQGIGALYVRDGVRLEAQLFGGGQQGGRRPGTLPVALCVGFGAACRIAREERAADGRRTRALADQLWHGLEAVWPGVRRNGHGSGLPHCLSATFPGLDAEDLLLDLPALCASTGSACATGAHGPSPVLLAMGRSPEEAHATIRFGLGRATTSEQIERTIALIDGVLRPALAQAG